VFNGVDVHRRPLKSHTERVIDPTEARVVRRIFELYDEGEGLKRIAQQLNRERAAAPKPGAHTSGCARDVHRRRHRCLTSSI
jgi:hypothetical protein